MTECTSVGVASEHVQGTLEINDGDEVRVCIEDGITRDLFIDDVNSGPLNMAALKCIKCRHVTVHDGFEIRVKDVHIDSPQNPHRFYLCTNCGAMSKK